jgi:hypothetical protein
MDCIDPRLLEIVRLGMSENTERTPISEVHCYSHGSAGTFIFFSATFLRSRPLIAPCQPAPSWPISHSPENKTVRETYFWDNQDYPERNLHMNEPMTESRCRTLFLEEDGLNSERVTATNGVPPSSSKEEAKDGDESSYTAGFGIDRFSLGKEFREFKYDLKFVETCLLPLRDVKDALIELYFSHVHPFLPVVDEYGFILQYHNCKHHSHLMTSANIMLLLAVLFAGFAVRVPTLPC